MHQMKIAPSGLTTPRLWLRRLLAGDRDVFAALNADKQVMEFFPRPWSFEESNAALERIEQNFQSRGFGIYAVNLQSTMDFVGVVGLSVPSFEAHFTPCVEILWRLTPRCWGNGFASEAAAAVLSMAFQILALPEIVAFTAINNERSIRVMEKIGMKRDLEGDFDNPAVMEPRLKRHVLYRATS